MMTVLHADDDTIVPKHGPEVGAEMLKIERIQKVKSILSIS
jgi:hypothetical protein